MRQEMDEEQQRLFAVIDGNAKLDQEHQRRIKDKNRQYQRDLIAQMEYDTRRRQKVGY